VGRIVAFGPGRQPTHRLKGGGAFTHSLQRAIMHIVLNVAFFLLITVGETKNKNRQKKITTKNLFLFSLSFFLFCTLPHMYAKALFSDR
jgi:uncharacterized membrane protein YsdA (DUF1294 family)